MQRSVAEERLKQVQSFDEAGEGASESLCNTFSSVSNPVESKILVVVQEIKVCLIGAKCFYGSNS
jgi:bisphosphoglycerate-dependent phosphoglycerate mutase